MEGKKHFNIQTSTLLQRVAAAQAHTEVTDSLSPKTRTVWVKPSTKYGSFTAWR